MEDRRERDPGSRSIHSERYIPEEDVRIEVQAELAPGFGDLDVFAIATDIKRSERPVVFEIGTGGSIASRPLVSGNMVYFGCCDHNFYCLNLNGEEVWRFGAGGQIVYDAVINNGTIYFGCFDKNLYALSPEGKLLWKFSAGHMTSTNPLARKGVVYFGALDSNLYALDTGTGKMLWKKSFPLPIAAPLTMHNSVLYLGCWDCNLYAIDLNGKTLWKFHTSLGYPAPVDLEPEYQTSAVAVWDVPERDKKLYDDEIQTGDYGNFSGTYVDITRTDYLGGKKRDYLKKP